MVSLKGMLGILSAEERRTLDALKASVHDGMIGIVSNRQRSLEQHSVSDEMLAALVSPSGRANLKAVKDPALLRYARSNETAVEKLRAEPFFGKLEWRSLRELDGKLQALQRATRFATSSSSAFGQALSGKGTESAAVLDEVLAAIAALSARELVRSGDYQDCSAARIASDMVPNLLEVFITASIPNCEALHVHIGRNASQGKLHEPFMGMLSSSENMDKFASVYLPRKKKMQEEAEQAAKAERDRQVRIAAANKARDLALSKFDLFGDGVLDVTPTASEGFVDKDMIADAYQNLRVAFRRAKTLFFKADNTANVIVAARGIQSMDWHMVAAMKSFLLFDRMGLYSEFGEYHRRNGTVHVNLCMHTIKIMNYDGRADVQFEARPGAGEVERRVARSVASQVMHQFVGDPNKIWATVRDAHQKPKYDTDLEREIAEWILNPQG